MKKISFDNIHKPTPANWSKFGLACVSASAFIGGYGLTAGNAIVGYIGLGIGFVGTFVSTLFAQP